MKRKREASLCPPSQVSWKVRTLVTCLLVARAGVLIISTTDLKSLEILGILQQAWVLVSRETFFLLFSAYEFILEVLAFVFV